MTQFLKPDFTANNYCERVTNFCFTDIRVNITPAQSLLLHEQLLRLTDVFTGIAEGYYSIEGKRKYRTVSNFAKHISKRFHFIDRALKRAGISPEAMLLFKRELADSIYADCVALNDNTLKYSLRRFLYHAGYAGETGLNAA